MTPSAARFASPATRGFLSPLFSRSLVSSLCSERKLLGPGYTVTDVSPKRENKFVKMFCQSSNNYILIIRYIWLGRNYKTIHLQILNYAVTWKKNCREEPTATVEGTQESLLEIFFISYYQDFKTILLKKPVYFDLT